MTDEEFEKMLAGLPVKNEDADPISRAAANVRQPTASSVSSPSFTVIPDQEEDSFFDKAGRFARGFGAGYAGKGEDYLESVRNQRQQKDMKLLQASALDARAIQQAIQGEDMPKAIDVLVDRMSILERMGEDTSDTKMLRDALLRGRPDIVMGELNTFLNALPKQTIDPKMITDQGQMVTQRLGGDPTAQTVAGFTPEEPDKPATLRALEERARLAGIPEGSEAYKRFMEFGGGSYQETAKLGVKYRNGTIINYPAFGDPIVYENGVRITDPAGIETAIKAGIDSGILEAGGIAGAQALAKGQEERSQEVINRGRSAAESTALLRRTLSLLDSIPTGGLAAAKLAATDFLGVTGADEGELSANLGRAVLSQLRETFGAAFTEREGARLDRLSARFGRSTASNQRIIQQALMIATESANRAIARAEDDGDIETASEIEDMLLFEVAPQKQRIKVDAEGNIID
jgi:hypothetical protein